MADFRAEQANFTYGQLDPRLQARTDYEGYYKGALNLENCIIIPQGGVQRRFGTDFVFGLPDISDSRFAEISTLNTSDGAVYLLIWTENQLNVILENTIGVGIIPTTTTNYAAEDVQQLKFTQVNDRLIVTHPYYPPAQLIRTYSAPLNIIGMDLTNNTLVIPGTLGLSPGTVLPIQFATTTSLPTTIPQIHVNRTYFALFITTNSFQIFSTADEAGTGAAPYLFINTPPTSLNPYTIFSFGVGATASFANTWTLSTISFINIPAYDFGMLNYSAINFTPSATSGNNVTITASAPIFTPDMVGGLFSGNGGILRIVTFTDTTHISGFTIESFLSTSAIPGSLTFLGEPAWSNTRFWPQTCSFIQNRLVFGGSPQIQNGLWLSTPNEVFNFDDSELLPDSAISWYPSSNQGGKIVNLTAASSLIMHTTTGNYSSPVFTEQPLTPLNFVMTENNKDGVSTINPVFIDNQILYVDQSGNNIKDMVWEFQQSKYVLNNASVPSSNLIKNPIDMTAFSDPTVADGYFVVVVNSDGTLAIFQTLKAESIKGWTPAVTVESIYTADLTVLFDKAKLGTLTIPSFVRIASSLDWCWFIVNRIQLFINAGVSITGFNAVNNTLTAIGHGIPMGSPQLISFSTTGTLPLTSPQITTNQFFWAIALSPNTFQVYGDYGDALSLINEFSIMSSGTASDVNSTELVNQLLVESLNFNSYTDCTVRQYNVNSQTVTLLTGSAGAYNFNGQYVSLFADGYVYPNQQVFDNSITFPVVVQNVSIGFPYISTFSPLPYANLQNGIGLYKPKHVRGFYVNYYLSLGLKIQGYDIPTLSLNNVPLNTVPAPKTGVYLFDMMEDWDPFSYVISITQSNPLPMTILGIGYILEV